MNVDIGIDLGTANIVMTMGKRGVVLNEPSVIAFHKRTEQVVAIGNALGYGQSVTTGIGGAVNRQVGSSDSENGFIQTDAAINSGNSGGALVNSQGQVIGINTLKVSSTGVEGIGFAIPINSTTDIINQLIT